eukprot:Opistho-1_new@91618
MCLFRVARGGNRLLSQRTPHAHIPVLSAGYKVLFVDVFYAIDRARVAVEHKLRLLRNFPYPRAAVATTRRHRPLTKQAVNCAHTVLVAKQGLHIGHLVHIPDLDRPVLSRAEQRVRHAPKGNPVDRAAVSLEHLGHFLLRKVPHDNERVTCPRRHEAPVTAHSDREHVIRVPGVSPGRLFPTPREHVHLPPRRQVPLNNGRVLRASVRKAIVVRHAHARERQLVPVPALRYCRAGVNVSVCDAIVDAAAALHHVLLKSVCDRISVDFRVGIFLRLVLFQLLNVLLRQPHALLRSVLFLRRVALFALLHTLVVIVTQQRPIVLLFIFSHLFRGWPLALALTLRSIRSLSALAARVPSLRFVLAIHIAALSLHVAPVGATARNGHKERVVHVDTVQALLDAQVAPCTLR